MAHLTLFILDVVPLVLPLDCELGSVIMAKSLQVCRIKVSSPKEPGGRLDVDWKRDNGRKPIGDGEVSGIIPPNIYLVRPGKPSSGLEERIR
jgi:hypothetical protein